VEEATKSHEQENRHHVAAVMEKKKKIERDTQYL
jgi:hypothetical protein